MHTDTTQGNVYIPKLLQSISEESRSNNVCAIAAQLNDPQQQLFVTCISSYCKLFILQMHCTHNDVKQLIDVPAVGV